MSLACPSKQNNLWTFTMSCSKKYPWVIVCATVITIDMEYFYILVCLFNEERGRYEPKHTEVHAYSMQKEAAWAY